MSSALGLANRFRGLDTPEISIPYTPFQVGFLELAPSYKLMDYQKILYMRTHFSNKR